MVAALGISAIIAVAVVSFHLWYRPELTSPVCWVYQVQKPGWESGLPAADLSNKHETQLLRHGPQFFVVYLKFQFDRSPCAVSTALSLGT